MPRLFHVAIVAVAATSVAAYPEFPAKIPNGAAHTEPSSGISCDALGHEGCVAGATRNSFGVDFLSGGIEWTKELCMMDSDGDGVTNG